MDNIQDNKALCQRIEEVSLNAWPAIETLVYDGWLIRFADGYTKRANSANLLYPSSLGWDDKLTYCENYYRNKSQPSILRITSISPDIRMDDFLQVREYTVASNTLVLGMPLVKPLDLSVRYGVRQLEFSEWTDLFFKMKDESQKGAFIQMMSRSSLPATYWALFEDNAPVCFGAGIGDDGYIGLFNVYTHPDGRRKGYARVLITKLLDQSIQKGAHFTFLQVEAENSAAIRLYESLGYKYLYEYWYRIKSGI
ncbi:MAG: GNAT family N-acetyltransferase [Anaerolineales bacterium]|nr:GNAT family N-acetyltransferase [Anaerolineales bacterium]